MKLIRGLHNLNQPLPGCVATIGNFDGLHLGHQHVINQLKAVAEIKNLPSVVIVFEPQPVEYFAPEKAPRRLARFRDKINHISDMGIDIMVCLQFNKELAQLTAAQFVEKILIDRLNLKHLVIGDDFRFGKERCGDFKFLQHSGQKLGFEVENSHTLLIDDQRVSSTRIRQCLANNDMLQARQLLGHPYTLSGRVAHGKKLGRELGFPTINLKMGKRPIAVNGIFAVLVKGIDNRTLRGVASIGTRPTVNGVGTILEVYILNFSEQVYGYCVDVEILHKIRNEEKFDSLDTLVDKINQDIDEAHTYFEHNEILETT
ncbi:MAG: bifunctional riboflavin kinase/FAD synthetase [Gammaproteobacteria bacterium]|jgi:riboflavin kinase/FMN adenylyltransferase|nr:bifunctional riboflavin kinase/FAD synthetase [Gammaproteobacteria bacterium]MBT6549938.1 bifunctional riboflavin kinase/FAD synthetase [Gammaproteobacteria bacterium]MBT6700186.1 bifunctional riboflavin kinase/FAD synthetase [Gammaproteobacteria bacterium]